MRLWIAGIVVGVAALSLNAALVERRERPAEAFAGGRVLELDGPDLNIRDYGPRSDRAVVLLHGYSASIEWWEHVALPLAASGQRVIALDLVGHGGSEAPRDSQQYGAAGQASAVRRALEALDVRRAVLVGHSMGGAVAIAVAENDPQLVERVVVADTPADQGLTVEPKLARAACLPFVGPALDWFRSVDVLTDSSIQTAFASDYSVPGFAHRSLERLTYKGLCESDPTEELNKQRAVADRLAGLGLPVLVIWGEHDAVAPVASNVDRYRASGLTTHVIAGSGHSPMVEKPEEFLTIISDFIPRIQPPD